MVKQIQLAVCLLLLIFSASRLLAHETNALAGQTAGSVNVTGMGEVEAEPDQATLNISISATKLSLADAKAEADEKYQRVLVVIKDAGIDKKQYKVASLNSFAEYDWSNSARRYNGQKITRQLTITVDNLEKLSPLLQALVENDISTITSVSAGFKDAAALRQRALANAIADARSKAAFIASEFDRDIGRVINVNEQTVSQPAVLSRAYQSDSFARASTLEANLPTEAFGTQKITARIGAQFKLK